MTANTATFTGSTDNNYNGLTTVSAGILVLNKASSAGVHAFAGDLTVAGGTVRLAGTGGDQIADSAAVTVSSGTLDVNGKTETIRALSGSGNIVLAGGILTIADGNGANFSGSIAGTGSLTKSGTGTQYLSGANLYNGPTSSKVACLVLAVTIISAPARPANIVINGGALLATNTFILNSARGISVGATNTTSDIGTISVAAGRTRPTTA